jgi:hypothetical protein
MTSDAKAANRRKEENIDSILLVFKSLNGLQREERSTDRNPTVSG